jgi:hypothetical protein
VAVSGRITATFPLPTLANGLNFDIAVKLRVKDDAEMPFGLALAPGGDMPLHAAAARLSAATPATMTNLVAICFNETPL